MVQATIRDVARRAEVSVASVSRVLNGFENVSAATRERVTAAVSELGYVPHAGARSLSMSRTHAIGVVLPDLHGEFFSEFVRGMDRVATDRGFLLLLSNLHRENDLAVAAVRAMRGRVDGLLVMAPHLAGDELAAALPAGLPVVFVNTRRQTDQHDLLFVDNGAGAAAVARHFRAAGRRRIVHVAGPADNVDARERANAFLDALGEDLRSACRSVPGDFTMESGEQAVAGLLQSGHAFDAVFAANDNMAIGALRALRAAGRRVPGDVAVAGFDDIPLARHVGLTTVRVGIAELGEQACARLLDRLGAPGDEALDIRHPAELVVRQSSQDGRAEDPCD